VRLGLSIPTALYSKWFLNSYRTWSSNPVGQVDRCGLENSDREPYHNSLQPETEQNYNEWLERHKSDNPKSDEVEAYSYSEPLFWQYGSKTLEDTLNNLRAQAGGKCLKVIEIRGHANPYGIRLGPRDNPKNDKSDLTANTIDAQNVNYVANELKKLKLSRNCIIFLEGCNVGRLSGDDTWVQKLSDITGCVVFAPLSYCSNLTAALNTEGNDNFKDPKVLPMKTEWRRYTPTIVMVPIDLSH